MIRTYRELCRLQTFEERYDYLRLNGVVGEDTFGFDRAFNQKFYKSAEWRRVKNEVIVRDNACDLGVAGHEIVGPITIHHMNPISLKDIQTSSEYLLNPDYLVCVSHDTHNAIHYGDADLLPKPPVVRTPNDTFPWKR